MESIPELLTRQDGVISRRQVLECGESDHDIRRRLRRREWAQVHEGVYVDHTGRITWLQRAWAAVLAMHPAALSHQSAIRAADGPGRRDHDDGGPIHVAVDRDRVSIAPPGVVGHRVADFAATVQANASPPRVRIEEAVIDVAAGAVDELSAVATLSDAVRSRRTVTARLRAALAGRTRIARRTFLERVLDDVAAGTCSVLEHGYLERVERRHGLPVAGRQVRDSTRGTVHRDVDYEELGLLVELDGRLHHSSVEQHDLDLDRDLEAAVDGRTTVRLGWGQVFRRHCRTASVVARLLQQRGWPGDLLPCADCPTATVSEDSGGSRSRADCDRPLSA